MNFRVFWHFSILYHSILISKNGVEMANIKLIATPLKWIILGCTSNVDCREPQPTCDITSGRCYGCIEMGCTGHGFTCNQHTGKCVNKGLIWNLKMYNKVPFEVSIVYKIQCLISKYRCKRKKSIFFNQINLKITYSRLY